MTWVRLDDQFPKHPKVADVGPLGLALFTAGLCYCAQYLTDGAMTRGAARSLVDLHDPDVAPHVTPDYVIAKLVASGLWEETEAGYQVHDYLQYQPARDVVLAQRAEARDRMQRHRSREVQPNSERSSERPVPLNPEPDPNPVPTPDPPTGEKRPARARESAASAPVASSATNEPFETFAEGCAVLGIAPEEVRGGARKKQLGAISGALRDHPSADVLGCLRWLLSDDWRRERGVDFLTVRDNIGKWVLAGRPSAVAARASPNGARSRAAPDFSGIETVADAWERSIRR